MRQTIHKCYTILSLFLSARTHNIQWGGWEGGYSSYLESRWTPNKRALKWVLKTWTRSPWTTHRAGVMEHTYHLDHLGFYPTFETSKLQFCLIVQASLHSLIECIKLRFTWSYRSLVTYQTTKNYQMELCPDSATLFFYFLRCGWLHPRFKYVFVLVSTDLVGLTWLSEDVALTDSSTPLFSSSSVCRYGCDCVLLFFGFKMHTHTHTHTLVHTRTLPKLTAYFVATLSIMTTSLNVKNFQPLICFFYTC
jgi:hypothetical protein